VTQKVRYAAAARTLQTFTSVADWINNLAQGLGLSPGQYVAAAKLAEELLKVESIKQGSLSTAGHSLGGGLASAASLATGIGAYTYNSASLLITALPQSQFPAARASYIQQIFGGTSPINAYYMDWDILSFLQDRHFFDLPGALGNRMKKDGPYDAEITVLGITGIGGLAASLTGLAPGAIAAKLSAVGVSVYMGESHKMDVMMWGILGAEINGYDMPFDVL